MSSRHDGGRKVGDRDGCLWKSLGCSDPAAAALWAGTAHLVLHRLRPTRLGFMFSDTAQGLSFPLSFGRSFRPFICFGERRGGDNGSSGELGLSSAPRAAEAASVEARS